MNLLGAKLYDPAVAVSKATSALLAMTALDTTNLRVAVTVPTHGMLHFVLKCTMEGATTFPQILLGVMNGATVIGRVTPQVTINGTALATTRVACWAEFTSVGLTPGAMNCDAAYGVEILLASTNIKYGGPNDTTTDNAWGAFSFEVYDPQPIPVAAPGAAGGLFIAGTNAATSITTGLTAHIIGTVDTLTTYTGNTPQTGDSFARIGALGAGLTGITGVTLAATQTGVTIPTVTNLTNAPTAGDLTATMKTSIENAAWEATAASHNNAGTMGNKLNAAGGAADPWATVLPGAYGAGTAGKIIGTNLDATVSSRSVYAGGAVASVTAGVTLAASQHVIVDSGTVTTLTNLPAITANWLTAAGINANALNGKGDWLLASGYTVPPTAVQNRQEMDTNSTKLANIPTNPVLTTDTRLNNLDAPISALPTAAANAAAGLERYKRVLNPADGTIKLYDSLGNLAYSGLAYMDAAGTRLYDGTASVHHTTWLV